MTDIEPSNEQTKVTTEVFDDASMAIMDIKPEEATPYSLRA